MNKNIIWISVVSLPVTLALMSSCGKNATPAAGNATIQSAALSPTSTASLSGPPSIFGYFADILTSRFMSFTLGERAAIAATVSTFKTFQLCNDTLVITDTNGNTVNPAKTGLGILNFSNSATTPTVLTSLNIAAGTQIKEIDITSAGNNPTCAAMGANAVVFDPGTGAINITQNTAFKFVYATPLTVTGSAQSLTLMFGAIVNGMVAQGTGLNNSTIQNIAVAGVAQ